MSRILNVTLLVLASRLPVAAQTLSIPFSLTQSSPALTFALDGNGVFLATGTGNGTSVLTSGEQGPGTRFLWYPGKAALRAGTATGTEWNDANIGSYSVALGTQVTAGYGCVALGDEASATGEATFATSYSQASGEGSVAMAGGIASGFAGSVAIGNETLSSATFSTALGCSTIASANTALATGCYTTASGNFSATLGYNTTAAAEDAVALGQYNVGGGSASSWVATDPLFEVGNGTSSSAKSDALVVYKNGTAKFAGAVTVPQSGDIPMYTGN